jgi:hypothetical protein
MMKKQQFLGRIHVPMIGPLSLKAAGKHQTAGQALTDLLVDLHKKLPTESEKKMVDGAVLHVWPRGHDNQQESWELEAITEWIDLGDKKIKGVSIYDKRKIYF